MNFIKRLPTSDHRCISQLTLLSRKTGGRGALCGAASRTTLRP